MTGTRDRRGFTLIEVLVVMLLLVIILGMVSLNLGGDDTAAVREEARRLAALLQTAQQESILKGRVLAVILGKEGYSFLELGDDGKFRLLERDDILRPRTLPPGVSLSAIEIEGAAGDDVSRLLLFPTGELLPFTLTVSHGRARWQVQGAYNGEIRSRAPRNDDNRA